MEASISFLRKDQEDHPWQKIVDAGWPVHEVNGNLPMHFLLTEGAMTSGEPSVSFGVVDVGAGAFLIMNTSFDKFLAMAGAMMSHAEHHWGWERPVGYAVLPETARNLLRTKLIKGLEGKVSGQSAESLADLVLEAIEGEE